MATNVTKLRAWAMERDRLLAELSELQKTTYPRVEELNQLIKRHCMHPAVEEKSNYHSGGYDHRSETVTWDECILCGEKFNTKRVEGSYQ